MAIVFLLWHSIFKFCFHYFVLFRFIKFWHISVEFIDSFLCVFVTMLASQMKWFTVAYSAKSTKSYICNFNFHPFCNGRKFDHFSSFFLSNEWNETNEWIQFYRCSFAEQYASLAEFAIFAERKIDKLNRENSVIWIV